MGEHKSGTEFGKADEVDEVIESFDDLPLHESLLRGKNTAVYHHADSVSLA